MTSHKGQHRRLMDERGPDEGFFSMLKRGINGTHIHVSAKQLPKYLGGFEYRWEQCVRWRI
jgi:hypothetical protein